MVYLFLFFGVPLLMALLAIGLGQAGKSRPILVYCGIGLALALIGWAILSSGEAKESPRIDSP